MAGEITEGVRVLWGPHYFPDHRGDLEHLVLTPHQQSEIERRFGIIADIRLFDPLRICVGPTCARDNAGMRWLGRGLSRLIDIPRLIDKFRLVDEAHPV